MKYYAIAASLLLTSCASVSISNYQENRELAPTRLPTKITVLPSKSVLPEGKHAELHAKGKYAETIFLDESTGHQITSRTTTSSVGYNLSKATEKQLLRFIQQNPKGEELLIESRINVQQKGSRALRVIVGLGYGKTKLETKTRVYNTSKSTKIPWLEIWTTGGSNREPGVIFAATPSPLLAFNILAAAGTTASIINGSGKGLTQDGKRTGKLIGSFIIEQLREEGQPLKRQSVKYANSIRLPMSNTEIHVPFTKPITTNTTVYEK